MNEIRIDKKEQLDKVVQIILKEYKDYRVFAFYGEMGSGKTTVIQEICRTLNMKDLAISPTFAIVNEYHSGKNRVVYHFDFYRIETLEEVFDFGYEEYFYSGEYCFIEWPKLIEDILPVNTIPVHINVGSGEKRIFRIGT